jgi:hypothetical protein
MTDPCYSFGRANQFSCGRSKGNVTPAIVVSPRIREEYENGREYYALHGRPLAQPQNSLAIP